MDTIIWLLRGCVGGWPLRAAAVLFLLYQKLCPAHCHGASGSVAGLLFSSAGFGLFFPYSLMLLGMNSNKEEDVLAGSFLPFFLSCGIFLMIFLWCGIRYLKKTDVKAY